jgi:hypothetical protein
MTSLIKKTSEQSIFFRTAKTIITNDTNIFGHPAPANCFVGRPEKHATDFGTLSGGFKWPSK